MVNVWGGERLGGERLTIFKMTKSDVSDVDRRRALKGSFVGDDNPI